MGEARPLVERGWRYVLVGVICALTNYAIMLTVEAAGGHYLLGTVIAFVGTTPVGYFLHSRFTFGQPLSWRGLWRFYAGVASAYPVAAAMMIALCDGLNLSVAVATPITTVGVFGWNFIAAHWAILSRVQLWRSTALAANAKRIGNDA